MARVTVEDCVERVPNRFDLVMMAAQRARDISAGAQLTVERDNDKNPVVALREIADVTVEPEALQESLVRVHQKHIETDEAEEEIIELMAGEEDWLAKGVEPTGDSEMPPAEEAPDAAFGPAGDEEAAGGGDPMDELARRLEEELDLGGDDAGDDAGDAATDAASEDDGTA